MDEDQQSAATTIIKTTETDGSKQGNGSIALLKFMLTQIFKMYV